MTDLPPKVTAVLVDDDGHRAHVYRLADERGYTHQRDTIRIRPAALNGADTYVVEALRRDGWTELFIGDRLRDTDTHEWSMPYQDAILRAVAILFGMEAHG